MPEHSPTRLNKLRAKRGRLKTARAGTEVGCQRPALARQGLPVCWAVPYRRHRQGTTSLPSLRHDVSSAELQMRSTTRGRPPCYKKLQPADTRPVLGTTHTKRRSHQKVRRRQPSNTPEQSV